MGDVVVIRCPETGETIGTGIETDEAHFVGLELLTFKYHCPFCHHDHPWDYTYAWLATEIKTAPPPKIATVE